MTDTVAFTTSTREVTSVPGRTGGPRAWWLGELRPLLRRLHFYAGLLVAPFLLVAAVTGLLYTLTPQLEQLVHGHQLDTEAPPGAPPLPLSRQVETALAVLPADTVAEIRPPVDRTGTTRVSFNDPGVPDGDSRTVFVDPYTGEVRGVLTTSGEWLPVRAWFDELHRTLHLGGFGRLYSELAASWLWVLTLSGLVMWVTRRRAQRRLLFTPTRRGAGRARLLSWHGSVGVWIAAGLLFLSATGLTWSQFAGANVATVRHALSWSTPSVPTAITSAGPTTGAGPVSPTGLVAGAALARDAERVLGSARSHGLGDPVALDPPTQVGHAWMVSQVQRSWPEKQDSMAIDGATGTVAHHLRFADWAFAAKLARWGIDAHMGLLFGPANQIALAALALGLITMIVCGYRMWWLRRDRWSGFGERDRAGFGTVAGVALVAVGIGVFLPVFGGSLLVFLAVDGLRSQRRSRPADGRPG